VNYLNVGDKVKVYIKKDAVGTAPVPTMTEVEVLNVSPTAVKVKVPKELQNNGRGEEETLNTNMYTLTKINK
jgi:hypothetical protein